MIGATLSNARSALRGTLASSADARAEPAACSIRRDTRVADDPYALRSIGLRSFEGQAIVRRLRATDEASASVTGARREQKAPIPAATIGRVLGALPERGIALERREEGTAGRIQQTLTYYGTGAAFYNHQERTKIRLRMRFYVSHLLDEGGAATDVQRAPSTADRGYLEIKIKTPRPGETAYVDKHRLIVPDDLLARLVHLDPTAVTFIADLHAVRDALLERRGDGGRPLNDPRKVEVMCDVIGEIATRDPRFLAPALLVSYKRAGYAFREPNYPVPVAEPPKKKPWWSLSKPAAPTTHIEPRSVQYQLTIDEDIRAHFPLLPAPGADRMPVEQHLDPARATEFARYPEDVRVVEFKEPREIATLAVEQRTAVHRAFDQLLVGALKADIQWGLFRDQLGKYGAFRGRVQRHHARLELPREPIALQLGHD